MTRHLSIKERLVTLFLNGTRKSTIDEYIFYENELSKLLNYIKQLIQQRNYECNIANNEFNDFENAEYGFYLQTIFRMILYTRNTTLGKGERDISYCMVYALFSVYPEKAIQLLTQFVMENTQQNIRPVGGWMDMKKMADYVYVVKNQPTNHPLIRHCVFLTNTQLYIDYSFASRGFNISDVALWIPREKSAHAWFFHELANDWGLRHKSCYFTHAKTLEQIQRAERKNTMQYRKMVSRVSAKCSSTKPPRMLSQFVCDALRLLRKGSVSEIHQLNNDWKTMICTYDSMQVGNVLPVLDISLSMKEENELPLHSAIGVACFLLEKTAIEKRIMTIDQTPSWIVIPNELPFVSMVEMIHNVVTLHGGTNKNVFRTMDILASSFGLCGHPVTDISMVIISDMKFSHFRDISIHSPIDEYIRSWFLSTSHTNPTLTTHGSFCPHIAYWNVGISKMHPTDEYTLPCDYSKIGATVVSGDVGNVAEFILPEWHYDCLQNPCVMIANTPFDSMCSVLSRHVGLVM